MQNVQECRSTNVQVSLECRMYKNVEVPMYKYHLNVECTRMQKYLCSLECRMCKNEVPMHKNVWILRDKRANGDDERQVESDEMDFYQ